MNYIDKILKSSGKAELLEEIGEALETMDKVVVVLIEDKENGKFSSLVMTLGLDNNYEAYGVLEVAKQDLQREDIKE